MHLSAMNNAAQFFDAYSASIPMEDKPRVIDIGSQDVNGSLRQVTPAQFEYVGLDFQRPKVSISYWKTLTACLWPMHRSISLSLAPVLNTVKCSGLFF